MHTFSHLKWLVSLALLIIFTGFTSIWNAPPGLFNAEPIGAFVNGNLPSQEASGDIVTTPIYTNIQWESPIVALPFPQNNNMLIVEMDGRFFSVSSNENTSNRSTVLNIQNRTWYYNWNANNASTKHGGIQNVAFHPEFGQGQGNDYIYVYYIYKDDVTPSSNGFHYNRLSRFTWTGNSFNPNSELIMINQYDTSKGHDGSGLTFGNDGFLYVSVGDEGTQNGAATAHTQRIDDRFRSGVWRIDVDQQGGNVSHPINRQPSSANVANGATQSSTQGYFIPNDNPWVNPNGSTLEEFYALGLRQPFRMTNDELTGNIWIGDVGGGQREEIDLLDGPGYNYEWNYKEGTSNGFRPKPNPFIGTERPPVYDYPKTGSRAVIGGYIYRGNDIPSLVGKYIFGDNGTGDIFALTHTTGNSHQGVEEITETADSGTVFSGISSFGLDQNDEMLVLKLGAGTLGNGRIYRLSQNNSNNNNDAFPNLLSQTGIFSNLNNLTTVPGIIPYDVNNPLWSAGTDKRRWVAIPNDGNVNSNAERIDYDEDGSWGFPVGTVFIKHFENPNGQKLETRLWIHGTDGNWFGTTYRWNNQGTDAVLLMEGGEANITIDGETFPYLFPSVSQCQSCHTPSSGDVLGFRTHQLNKDIVYPSTGLVGNQLETFAQLGFIPNVNTNSVITSYALEDNTQSLEARARSYFDSNCSHCHQPGANRAVFDSRYTTPLAQQSLINGEAFEDLGINGAQIITPQSIETSVLYQRINTTEGCCAMPPLARGRVDHQGVQLVANWINSLGANCNNNSSLVIGNPLDGPTNFVDGHNPAINVNEGDAYTNTSGSPEELCIIDFDFRAQRLGNPITPFIARVNSDNNFTILSVGQSRTSSEYSVGNNSFAYSDHSDDVLILAPGETIAIGFMDALPTSPDPKIQSVIPALQGGSEDEVWQSFTSTATTNPALFPTLTVGESPGLGTQGPANLNRTYRFNIGIDVSGVTTPTLPTNPSNPTGPCSDNLAIGKTATQSSTLAHATDFNAGNAIDGNTAGNVLSTLTHTNSQSNAWWEIDLGDVYQLSSVRLWNRTNCCGERLTDFHVLVSDVPFNNQALTATINQNGVGDFHFPGTPGAQTDINLNRTGRYLRVQLSGTNVLTLAEVEIFGCEMTTNTPAPNPSDCNTVALPGRIEAEDFCAQSGIQVEPSGDAGGGENVGFVDAGDYMEYQIQVATAGSYSVNYRVASNLGSGGAIQLQLNGNNIGNIAIPGTGGWQNYTTVSNNVNLTQGTHTLRVFAQQSGWNLNWIDFNLNNNPNPVEPVEPVTPVDPESPVCQCASGQNSILVNGSFEETSNPAFDSAYDLIEAIGNNNSGVKFIDRHPDTDFPGWFTTGGIFNPDSGNTSTGGTLELGQSGFLGFQATDGRVFAELDGNHHDQIINVTPGQVLDWELDLRGRFGTDVIRISAGPVGNLSVIATASSPNTNWVTHTGQYQVPNGVNQIQFRITPFAATNDDLDSSHLMDNVKVCPASSNGTPPPPADTDDCANPQNIALGKSTSQSSTLQGNNSVFGAANAVDGDNNGNHTANSMTHTNSQPNAWWEIDLGSSYDLSSIRLWNRTNCCADRLSDFHVLVSDVPFNSQGLNATINQNGVSNFDFPGTAGRQTDISLGRTGRYLRVQLGGTNPLQLAEVEIFGCNAGNTAPNPSPNPNPNPNPDPDPNSDCNSPSNVALNKSTQQSTTLNHANNFESSNAVDGNRDGNHTNNSITHTLNSNSPWWQVDLGSVYDLSSIKIWNRTNCCAERLTNFHVLVSNVPFNSTNLGNAINQNGVGNFHFPGTAGTETDIDLDRTGRYVRIQLSGAGVLTLAEVEIMGCAMTQGFSEAETREAQRDLSATEASLPVSNIIANDELSEIHISPNPAIDYLTVDVSHHMNESIDYSIQSIDGASIFTGRLQYDHDSSIQLDLSTMNNGLYIIHMKPENHNAVAIKFLVAKF